MWKNGRKVVITIKFLESNKKIPKSSDDVSPTMVTKCSLAHVVISFRQSRALQSVEPCHFLACEPLSLSIHIQS